MPSIRRDDEEKIGSLIIWGKDRIVRKEPGILGQLKEGWLNLGDPHPKHG